MNRESSLHDIGLKHGTDKSTYHMYMDVYERHIDKQETSSFLEIGVQGGFSLKAWREWLPKDAHVEGWDILDVPKIDGCTTKVVDQSSRTKMGNNLFPSGYDVILDDGGHTPKLMETSFSFLFPHSKIYIIEDLHAWWLGYAEDGDKTPTVDLLQSISDGGWNSKYATKEESDYVSRYAKLSEVFFRGEREAPDSMTAIIYNMEKFND
jgi:hypothetical protein